MIRLFIYLLLTIATVALLVGPVPSEAKGRVLSKSNYNYMKDSFSQLNDKEKYVLARNAILKNQSKYAISILSKLPKNLAPKGEIEIMIGRAYFQISDFTNSLKWYNEVSKDSDFWLEAQEEKAWVLYRTRKFADLKSVLETLLSPVFSDLVHSETYYLASLMHLDNCDYLSTLKVSQQFKTDYKDRVTALENIDQQDAFEIAKRKKNKGKSHIKYGSLQKRLPLYFYRDREFFASDSAIGVTSSLRRLSQEELKEVSSTIKRLHLVEAEVIQRVHNNNDKLKQANSNVDLSGDDILVFPKNTDEVWADEIENFQASIKECKPGRVTL